MNNTTFEKNFTQEPPRKSFREHLLDFVENSRNKGVPIRAQVPKLSNLGSRLLTDLLRTDEIIEHKVQAYIKENPDTIEKTNDLVKGYYAPALFLSVRAGIEFARKKVEKSDRLWDKVQIITCLRDGATLTLLCPQDKPAIELPLTRHSVTNTDQETLRAYLIDNDIKLDEEQILLFIDSSSTAIIPAQIQYSFIGEEAYKNRFILVNPVSDLVNGRIGGGGWVDRYGIKDFLGNNHGLYDLFVPLEAGLSIPLPEIDKIERTLEGNFRVVYSQRLRSHFDIALNRVALEAINFWLRADDYKETRTKILKAVESGKFRDILDEIVQKRPAAGKHNPLSDEYPDRPKNERKGIYFGS